VEQLSLPEGNFRVGILYSAYGAGALVSGLLFARVFSTRRVRWITPISIGLSSAIAVGLVVSTNWRLSGLLLLLFSWSVTTTITTGITYRQLAAPDDLRSSVNVFGRMISWGGQPFGAGAGALISALLDVRAAYVFTVVVTAISATMAYVFLHPGTEIAGT
jgi:predicted MFS family arabinose efflux permease